MHHRPLHARGCDSSHNDSCCSRQRTGSGTLHTAPQTAVRILSARDAPITLSGRPHPEARDSSSYHASSSSSASSKRPSAELLSRSSYRSSAAACTREGVGPQGAAVRARRRAAPSCCSVIDESASGLVKSTPSPGIIPSSPSSPSSLSSSAGSGFRAAHSLIAA